MDLEQKDEMSVFCSKIKNLIGTSQQLDINRARAVIKNINDFLYTNHEHIGETQILEQTYEYFSEFHKYWEKHHKEILNCRIDRKQAIMVADALHLVYKKTKGSAFSSLYDTYGLSPEEICKIRILTANQDFRGSRKFKDFADIYIADPSIFDEEQISKDPSTFINEIGLSELSQNDKRTSYAQNIANFIIRHKCKPYELIKEYNNNIYLLRKAMINCVGAGYGNKKTDMFLRDMIVLGIWKDVKGFEKIDVASDVNTIKVALRTSIIKTDIPLVSSFLDIFDYQYSHIENMNALAWRKVWEIWSKKYPDECVSSPCLIDYFVYNVIGKQFCKENLSIFQCDEHNHTFKWHSARNKTCQYCLSHGIKGIKAHQIKKVMACTDPEGEIAFLKTDFNMRLPKEQRLNHCPFNHICGKNRTLQPPKAISILGQTSWTSAYTDSDSGGGGLMA